ENTPRFPEGLSDPSANLLEPDIRARPRKQTPRRKCPSHPGTRRNIAEKTGGGSQPIPSPGCRFSVDVQRQPGVAGRISSSEKPHRAIRQTGWGFSLQGMEE